MGVGLREQYGAFNTALQSLYDDDTLLLAERGKNFEFDDAVFDEAVRRVYDLQGFDAEKLADPAIRELITETARILGAAIDKGLVGTLGSSVRGSESKSAPQELPAPTYSVEHEVPETLRYALENNAFTFSGFKTFHCMREVGLSLTNDEGHIKPFAEFLTDVKKINQKYNHHYLEAEYNHAVAASQMASRWHDFEQDGDDYNLQYRTADDDRVREDHAVLHNTTLPPSDPFWDKYFPPNGWNCRCTVVQVRKEKYPVSDPALAMLRGDNCTDGEKKKIFRYNPGKSLELFPPKHPYYKAPKDAKKEIDKLAVIEGRKNALEFMPVQDELNNYNNLSTGKLYNGNKPRKRVLSHCYHQDTLEAAIHFWNNPQLLSNPRISILGENKDMTTAKAQKNIEKKIKRGVCEYIEYKAEYKGATWSIKTERHKKGFEQFYCIKKEN